MSRASAMRRCASVVGICAVAWSSMARAADPPQDSSAPTVGPPLPGADQIQFAAREHDLGYRAYVERRYADAASHFENAFFAAPNPAELRSAIRARRDSGEWARAATLAAIGQRRFPADAATSAVADDTIAQARPHVYEVQISSSAEYSVAIDEKSVASERVKESRVFVTPGFHQLLVSWSDDQNQHLVIDAKEGGAQTLHVEPTVEVPPPQAAVAPAPGSTPSLPRDAAAESHVGSKPFGPAVFVTGAALTAVGLGVTVWSGIDTLNSPGTATVKAACKGRFESCPAYVEGRDNQLRTNVLVAVTSGLALATTVVGIFFTEWSPPRTSAGVSVVAHVAIGQVRLDGTF